MTTLAHDCCANPQEPCQHRLVTAASREAQHLSTTERDIIMAVLKRNEELQRDQQHRIIRLKTELQHLRRKGALRTSSADGGDSSMAGASGPDPERTCGRCRIELGRVINRGAYCRACRLKVCKSCREYSSRTTDWVCTVCYKHMEIQAASGEWMNEFVRRPSRRRDNRVYVPAADIIKRTIRRSWTISNPSPRWNAPRNFVEIRPYSSLPRGQELANYPTLVVRRASAMVMATGTVEAVQPQMQPLQLQPQQSMILMPSPNLLEPPDRRHSSGRRSHSEDVYSETIASAELSDVKITPLLPPGLTPENPLPSKQSPSPQKSPSPNASVSPRQIRVNPLIKYASERKKEPNKSRQQHASSSTGGTGKGKGTAAADDGGRRSQSCKMRDLSPGQRISDGGGIFVQEKKKPLSIVAMSDVAAPTCSSRSESDDEEVQNYMLGNSGPGRNTRRKVLLQHTLTEQSQDLDMGRAGNSAFRSLDSDGSMVGARRMSEKRVSFDKNVETSSSESTPNLRPCTKPNRNSEDFLRSTKRKLPNNHNSLSRRTSAASENIQQQLSSTTTIMRKPLFLQTSNGCVNDNIPSTVTGITDNAVDNQVVAEVETPPELCDIEPISGTVFRKVTVRRRRQDMRKMAAVDNGWRNKLGQGDTSDHLESSSADGEDYKLVFISSDSSSSKDEDIEDNDSSSTASSFPVDECDWDYFEPCSDSKPLLNSIPPFGSPRVCRRNTTLSESSPLGSPLVYRRDLHNRDSDPGTDEDSTKYFDSGSSDISLNAAVASNTMADDWLQFAHNTRSKAAITASITANAACQSCGAHPQYVPVPVPVPIPVPVPAMWNTQECLIRYAPDAVEKALRSQLRVLPRGLWPFINQAALIWPLISAAAAAASVSTDQTSNNSPLWSLLKTCAMHEESATEGVAHIISSTGVTTATTAAGTSSSNNVSSSVSERNTAPATTILSSSATTDHYQNTCAPQQIHIGIVEGDIKSEQPESNLDEMEVQGYLSSESKYYSSTQSASSSIEGDVPTLSIKTKRRLSGSYDINISESSGDSDEALHVSEIEEPEAEQDGRHSNISLREDIVSSSGSDDTDTDPTGTVADQKLKRFTRVFVINKGAYSSSDEESIISNSDGNDTSDNDTDVERDCSIILTCVKTIGDVENIKQCDDNGNESSESEPVILLKQTDINNEFLNSNRKTVVLKDIFDKPHESCAISEKMTVSNKTDAMFSDINETTCNKAEEDIIQDALAAPNANLCDYIPSLHVSAVRTESLNSSDAELACGSSKSHCNVTSTDNNAAYNGLSFTGIDATGTTTRCDAHDTTVYSTTTLNECVAGDREVTEARIRSAAIQINSGVDCSHSNSTGALIEGEQQVLQRTNQTGVSVPNEGESECVGVCADSTAIHNNNTNSCTSTRHAATRYTSLVMITQESAPASYGSSQVSVVTTDTTTLVPDAEVVVQHTNEHDITLTNVDHCSTSSTVNNNTMVRPSTPDNSFVEQSDDCKERDGGENVTVITGADTLSAVVCLEEGLADDDSWVENLSHDEEEEDDDDDDDDDEPTSPEDTSSSEEVTLFCTAASDREGDLRGYHRAAIDFTLHTIVEESCEESEVECLGHEHANRKQRPASATDLEKYFCYGLSDNMVNAINANHEDAMSETSSVCSESIDSYIGEENASNETNELATSRLENYFLHGFMGFSAERRDSDGSVGSDSEGRPSPEQRRKRLVRARGTGRSHSSSLDNLITNSDLSGAEPEIQGSEHSSSSETDTYDESNTFDKSDGQFDTVKRKKCKKQKNVNGTNSPADDMKILETTQEINEEDYQSDEDDRKTPQLEHQYTTDFNGSRSKHQSRDSGFIGSCDDLIKEDKDSNNAEHGSSSKSEFKTDLSHIEEEKRTDERQHAQSTPPATSLTRKDSFNNWSSDEETNLMMCKMRQFFKTMVFNNHNQSTTSNQISPKSSKPTTPNLSSRESPKPIPSPRLKSRSKPPQLIYFENELTRLMKTVPGIRDDQVREIVEYLSSEDTWSDSYDSSDYTSSDLEGAVCGKSVLQQQISDSCKQIINKFETVDNEGDEGDGGIIDESHGFNRETAFVYQKLVASFEKMATGDNGSNEVKMESVPSNSPPLIAKVMHHIGSRLVALMHEVSSGESHASNSPKTRHYHRRLQQKLSNASSTTTEDDDSPADTLAVKLASLDDNMSYNLLPRSKSHDLLMGENKINQTNPTDTNEERETSDCERFSWRGSFESALLATDSRNKLSLIGGEGSASASALAIAAKRRSAGDLLFSHKSISREQLDRVRSCGSIGGANSEDKLWVTSSIMRPSARRRSSVPDASCGSGGSADGDEDEGEEQLEARSTLPRSLTATTASTTNSLPRLPTNGLAASPAATTTSSGSIGIFTKTQSVYHFLQNTNSTTSNAGSVSCKSARYRAPGYNSRLVSTSSVPKRAVSAPGLQPTHHRRGRRSQLPVIQTDDVSLLSEAHSSPMLAAGRASKSSTPSPVPPAGSRLGGSASSCLGGGGGSTTSGGESPADWTHLGGSTEEDIDRLVAIHHQRTSLSSLGLRSDSMASVYSGAGDGRYGTVTVRGQVEFGLQYNYKAGALEILVKQCKDLAAVDMKRNRSDPYVKVYLLPDKSKGGKRKTKVRKHTLSPVFEECLRFHISLNGLETRTLWLTVWHSDMFGRNDFLGEVMMSMENKVFDDPTPVSYNLQERTEPFDEILSFKGDVLVGLKFVPPDMTVHKKGKRSRGALHVLVKEAKSLTAIKANGLSDPFCKSYLLPDKGRGGKQKTPVVRRTINPVWNHTFVYSDVTLQELAERCLELTVWDHDRLASNEFLGGVRFSLGTGKTYGKPVDWMDATGKEMSLWKSMLERPNFWVEGCLSLRPTLDHRTY